MNRHSFPPQRNDCARSTALATVLRVCLLRATTPFLVRRPLWFRQRKYQCKSLIASSVKVTLSWSPRRKTLRRRRLLLLGGQRVRAAPLCLAQGISPNCFTRGSSPHSRNSAPALHPDRRRHGSPVVSQQRPLNVRRRTQVDRRKPVVEHKLIAGSQERVEDCGFLIAPAGKHNTLFIVNKKLPPLPCVCRRVFAGYAPLLGTRNVPSCRRASATALIRRGC